LCQVSGAAHRSEMHVVRQVRSHATLLYIVHSVVVCVSNQSNFTSSIRLSQHNVPRLSREFQLYRSRIRKPSTRTSPRNWGSMTHRITILRPCRSPTHSRKRTRHSIDFAANPTQVNSQQRALEMTVRKNVANTLEFERADCPGIEFTATTTVTAYFLRWINTADIVFTWLACGGPSSTNTKMSFRRDKIPSRKGATRDDGKSLTRSGPRNGKNSLHTVHTHHSGWVELTA
jgi:hypothetical protein